MSVATAADTDKQNLAPPIDSNLVVVRINGRCLGFRKSASAEVPAARQPQPPELPAAPQPEPPELPPFVKVGLASERQGLRDRCRTLERRLRVWWVSAMAHVAALLVLALVVIAALGDDGAKVLEVESVAAVNQPTTELETFQITDNDFSEFTEAVAPQSLTSPAALPDPNSDFGEIPASPYGTDDSYIFSELPPGPVGVANGDMFGRGSKPFQEVELRRSGAEFFGVRASGDNFVFVVDSSSSMRGKRWRMATRELLASIKDLSPHQSFYVIFFDAAPRPMFGKRLAQTPVQATDDNLLRLRRWMRNVEFGPATSPQTSVEFAMALKPDAVFLLTDGEFQDDTVDVLRDENQSLMDNGQTRLHTTVHTIGFHSRASQELLQIIATENGGSYRFVK